MIPLMRGWDWLTDSQRARTVEAVPRTLSKNAWRTDFGTSWRAVVADDKPPELCQYCHGAPGMVTTFADAPFTSPELETLRQTEPEEYNQAISPETADQVTQLMVDTVNNGTAGAGAIPGVQVAGKTGTAQSGVPSVPPYAWYVSFAPAQDPEVAVAVVIQKANIERGEIAGGTYGGPIAKAVMEAVIK